jgi:hypothetical protein
MQRRLPSLVSHALLACVPVLGLVVVAGAGAASAARTPVNPRAAALAALEHLMVGQHATNHLLPGRSVGPKGTPVQVQSSNWSGYADTSTSSKYTKVTGSWTEPSASCTSATSLAAFWVGIDGYSSGSVEQDGTLIECIGGTPAYYTWWEMYPSNAIQIVGSSLKPGDKIVSSVVKSGTSYTLKVTDSTTPANSFTTTQSCAAATCVDSSAEWIAEAPSGSAGVYPLSNFGSWTLKGATVKAGTTAGTISTFPDAEITMADSSKKVEAQPGPLNLTGKSFKVTWKSST